MIRASYERFGYTSVEMMQYPGTVIRDSEDAFGRAHDPDRVIAWLDAIGPSLFTSAGRAALARRWWVR